MEEYSYTSTHPVGHTGPVTESLYLYLLITMKVIVTINLSIELRIFLESMFEVISVALDAVRDNSIPFPSFLLNH